MMKSEILASVTFYYLSSGDFNGTSPGRLRQEMDAAWSALLPFVQELIEEDLVGALFGDIELNPHILRLGFPPIEVQIAKLGAENATQICLYPRPKHLQTVVTEPQYEGRPYQLHLALGEPQLAFRAFDLSILEFYRNDPRYSYDNNDISGSIHVQTEFYESSRMHERDQILLQTFGFAYDEGLNRATATFLRYLADLSPEHQQLWKTKELTGDYRLHPDYFKSTILGEWGAKIPICSAFIIELYLINRMAEAMGRPPLFNRDYGRYGEDRPQSLSLLVRPTLEEFNNFVLLLDKLLSDNLNKAFFRDEVSFERETERPDGKIVITSKGTLQILDEWMRANYRTQSWEPWDEAMKTLRRIRKLRQQPAHAINENAFDQNFFKEQRDLIMKAYEALWVIRMSLSNHPLVLKAQIEIPHNLEVGEIWTF